MTSFDHQLDDDAFVEEYLQGTSRTFALAIPLLSTERRRQIGLSYLLFRVADSIEDAPGGDSVQKKELLSALRKCLYQACQGSPSESTKIAASTSFRGLWPDHSPTGRLLQAFPRLMVIFNQVPISVSQVMCTAVTSTISGMISFIDASMDSPNQIQLRTLSDLRLYCYAVAGIVGEMLTEIFVCHHSTGRTAYQGLRQLSVGFGEFLQLINILKDSQLDASDGRVFIPMEASRESIFDLAMEGKEDAFQYIRLLEKNDFPPDIISFCRFLYLLADGSLQKLRSGGAGSKLTRDEVMRLLAEVKNQSAFLSA